MKFRVSRMPLENKSIFYFRVAITDTISISDFMAEQGMKMDMVKAIGLETLPHLLFHMDDLLEVRCREINGRPFYYLSVIIDPLF